MNIRFLSTGRREAGAFLVTSDEGYAAPLIRTLIRESAKYLAKYGPQNVDLFIVGRKGRDYFRRIGSQVSKEYVNI